MKEVLIGIGIVLTLFLNVAAWIINPGFGFAFTLVTTILAFVIASEID